MKSNKKPERTGFKTQDEMFGSRIGQEDQDEHLGTLSAPSRPTIGTVYHAKVIHQDGKEWKPVVGTEYTELQIGIVVPVEGQPDAIEVRFVEDVNNAFPRRLLIKGLKLPRPDLG